MTLIARKPPDFPGPPRFTREEYYRMADMGLFQDRRVELIHGELIAMAPMRDLHAVSSELVARALRKAFTNHWIRNQLPLAIGEDSEPEPDFAVVEGEPRDYKGKKHPATALLLVELADSSLDFDRKDKAFLYASAGIQDYWIVNLPDECVEVYRQPEPGSSPTGWRYAKVQTFTSGEIISPLVKPDAKIPVADMLP